MNVSLEQRWEGFIDEAVSAGRYPCADAVIEAGLAPLERQEATSGWTAPLMNNSLSCGGKGLSIEARIATVASTCMIPPR